MALGASVFFKNSVVRWSIDKAKEIPRNVSGIYILYHKVKEPSFYNVVYVGVGGTTDSTGIRSRILNHIKSEKKKDLFTHFSVYEVKDKIKKPQIMELEGLILQICAKDEHSIPLNVRKNYGPLNKIMRKDKADWIRNRLVRNRTKKVAENEAENKYVKAIRAILKSDNKLEL